MKSGARISRWKRFLLNWYMPGSADFSHGEERRSDGLDPYCYTIVTNGNRQLRIHDHGQVDFIELDQPQFVEVGAGNVTIAPGSPDSIGMGHGTLSVQNWRSVSGPWDLSFMRDMRDWLLVESGR